MFQQDAAPPPRHVLLPLALQRHDHVADLPIGRLEVKVELIGWDGLPVFASTGGEVRMGSIPRSSPAP